MTTALAQSYHYLYASALTPAASGPQLALASSSAGLHPHFFSGQFLQPRLTAELLSTVHRTVAARFFTPANTLAKAIALADPIVTAGGGLLRFEGFSGCGSTHVRVDLLPAAYAGDFVGSGCTNVDFNAAMRAALARVREDEPLFCEVGRSELALRSAGGEVVEKKVPLPTRWLRGLLEVQAYQARMRPRLEVNGLQALRFFRSLPKASTSRTPLWIAAGPQVPQSLSLGATPRPEAVRCADVQRLRLLEPLLARAQTLRLYADEAQQASAWELDFGSARLTLTLSAETWRGFSGEGQALRALMRAEDDAALASVRARLHWQAELDAATLATQLQLAPERVDGALQRLANSGLVGFDLHTRSYFHRELPLQREWVADFHPRLSAARALLAQQAVRLDGAQAEVRSGDTLYTLRRLEGGWRCTCPWFAKHQGERGPCKHALAVEALEEPGSAA